MRDSKPKGILGVKSQTLLFQYQLPAEMRLYIFYLYNFKFLAMHSHRAKRQGNKTAVTPSSRKGDKAIIQKIKFNISSDNLSCFIGEQGKRRLNSKFQSKISAHSKNKIRNRSQNRCAKKPEGVDTRGQREASHSPNVAIEASNSIINEIEDRGILCMWKDSDRGATPQKADSLQFPGECVPQQQNIAIENQNLWGECPLALTLNESISKRIHSFASTEDYYPYQTSVEYFQPLPLLTSSPSMNFQVQVEFIGNDVRTTLMIKNIPNKYTIKNLSEEIDIDHQNYYDFLYLPYDQKNCCNVGYGFINFLNTEMLKQFYLSFNNTRWMKFRSEKICSLTYARLQGLSHLIEHFENSKVLNQKDKKYRPIIKEFSKIEQMVKAQQTRGE